MAIGNGVLSQRIKEAGVPAQIIDLRLAGSSMPQICSAVYYLKSDGSKKFVSLGYVHKTLKQHFENKEEKK